MLTNLQKQKIVKLFSMYDTNNTGVINRHDFETIIKRLADLRNWSFRSSKYQILSNKLLYKWKCLQGGADTSHDRQISLDEWLAYNEAVIADESRFAEEVRSLMEVLFEAFDTDEDGKINEKNWWEFLSVYNVSPIYADMVFSRLDTDQDGCLSKDDLIQLVTDFYYSDDPNAPANLMFGPYTYL
jgi:Ca2+-binding EF-hand superfamily protein